MRIVDRAAFLAMPAGIIFAKYEPCVFGDLTIKGDTIGDFDFWLQDLIPWFEDCVDSIAYFETLDASARGEATPPLDFDCGSRDGLYDKDQLFAVYERDDVDRLIAVLQTARATAY